LCAARRPRPHAIPHHTQDLPPLLLARIFSQHLSWADVHGAVPRVCKAWRDAAAHIAPDRLSFEFDLAAEAGAAGSGAGAVAAAPASKGLLHSLLSAPARLLMHATGHALPAAAVPQAPAAPAQQAEQHAGSSSSSAAATAAERQEADMAALNEPWARWLAARGNRLLEFSMTITNLDSACAAAQCQLKETLLHALAGSAATAVAAATGDTPAGGMKLGDDDSDACGSAGLWRQRITARQPCEHVQQQQRV
jgi:hypothetical protein